MKTIKLCGVVIFLALFLSGCASDLTGTTYSAGEARQLQTVQFGTISAIQLVKLEGTDGQVGSLAGAVAGGAAASSIGGEREQIIAGVAGAVAGGILGHMAEKKITAKQGAELTIKLDNGSYVSVVQEVDPASPFQVGEAVKVLTQGKTSRVVKAPH